MENNNLLKFLTFIDKEHAVYINETIGLIGEFESEEEDKRFLDSEYAKKMCNIQKQVGNTGRRGDYYRVVDKDACILFDEYITDTLITFGEKNPIYVFRLKDYFVTDELDTFFDIQPYRSALIMYDGKELFTNCNQLNYKLINNFALSNYNFGIEKVFIQGKTYKAVTINTENNIYLLDNIRMGL